MVTRALYGALILLFLNATLGIALCGRCVSGHCPAGTMTGTSSPAEQDGSGNRAGHCQQAEDTDQATTACHGIASATVSSSCCDVVVAPAVELPAPPANPGLSSLLAGPLATLDLPVLDGSRAGELWRQPPLPEPQPLYTLHSSLLI